MLNLSAHERFSLSDEALLEMMKAGHDWALKEIFDRYHLRLFRLAAGVLKDEDISKDLVQDIFIDLWKRRASCDIRNLSNFLFRAIKFQVLNYIRNTKLHAGHLAVIGSIKSNNQTEDSLNLKETEEILQKAIEELPPRCREVFELSRMQNLSHKEISTKLNISTKTIEVQISKALAVLRERLK